MYFFDFDSNTLSNYDFIEIEYEEIKNPDSGAVSIKIETAKLTKGFFNTERESLSKKNQNFSQSSLDS